MIDLDDILEKRGLSYDKLTPDEKETYLQMSNALQTGDLTLQRVKEAIASMKESVENELIDEPEYIQVFIFKVRNLRNLYLKSRLKNYILIDALLTSPERTQRAIERQLGAMIDSRG